MKNAYTEMCQRERERAVLNSCAAVLAWDERTNLPPKGVPHRGEQLALLARLSHERLIQPQVADLLAKAESEVAPGSPEAANVRELRRLHERAAKVPTRLVEELARATSQGQLIWEEAKKKKEFGIFLPALQKIVRLKLEEAAAIGSQTGELYDALLDEYEPGLTSAQVRDLFATLRPQLVSLLNRIQAAGKDAPVEILQRHYPLDRQRILSELVARAIGFDFASGRLDVTVHPFCSSHGPGDVRLTTRYNDHFLNESLFGTLHEAGHGLYEQGLPAEHFGLALGSACSLGVHESQSRLWENMIGRSLPFWEWLFPITLGLFPDALHGVTLEDFYFAVNDVRPSYIRIEADEVTYNLHIILRFELEVALLDGSLTPAELPLAWNEKFKACFGLTPPNDALGCLQDVHWSAGLIGYFPTYTLGNLLAAQFLEQARRALPMLDDDCRRGRFGGLREWLATQIYQHGGRYRTTELCRRVCGTDLDVQPLLRHLQHKFLPLYAP